MILTVLFCLQVAAGSASPAPSPSMPPLASIPLARLEPLREDVSALLEHLRRTRSSSRSVTEKEPSSAQGTSLSPLFDELDQYADYFAAYRDAQAAVFGAVDHAYFVETPSCSATKEQIILGMGGSHVPNGTFIVATHPDANGIATVAGTSGGVATAQPLLLFPMSEPFTAPGGGVQFQDRPMHCYSATLTDGSQHSGMALELELAGQPTLVLYPDAVIGTRAIAPNDLAMLRWLLLENPTLQPSLVVDILLGPFSPPVWQAGGSQNEAFRQDIGAIMACCRAALDEWRTSLTASMLHAQDWGKSIRNGYANEFERLQDELKATLGPGSTLYPLMFYDDLTPIPPPPPAEGEILREFQNRAQGLADRKRVDEENLRDFLCNSIIAANNRLHSRLLDCLHGWPDGSAIAHAIYIRAAELLP